MLRIKQSIAKNKKKSKLNHLNTSLNRMILNLNQRRSLRRKLRKRKKWRKRKRNTLNSLLSRKKKRCNKKKRPLLKNKWKNKPSLQSSRTIKQFNRKNNNNIMLSLTTAIPKNSFQESMLKMLVQFVNNCATTRFKRKQSLVNRPIIGANSATKNWGILEEIHSKRQKVSWKTAHSKEH